MRSTGFAGQMGNAPLFIPRSTLSALDPLPQYTSKLRGCAPPFYPPYIAPPRPNTQPLFDVVGATPLQHSPSPNAHLFLRRISSSILTHNCVPTYQRRLVESIEALPSRLR